MQAHIGVPTIKKMFVQQSNRLQTRCSGLKVISLPTFPVTVVNERNQLVRDIEQFLFQVCPSSSSSSTLSFLESIQSYRDDMQRFHNLNSAIHTLCQRFSLPFSSQEQQYSEDRNDIEQDLQWMREKLESLSNNSPQLDQETRLLLRYARQDMNNLIQEWTQSDRQILSLQGKHHEACETLSVSRQKPLVEEIRQLKTHLEDLILNPASTVQQLQMISSLNDSLVEAIESSQDSLQSELRDLKEPLRIVQSDSDKLLQMSRFNLLSHQSQLWRREQLQRLTIASESIRVSSKKLGEGGFAKVFLGSCPGHPVIAIKQISHGYRDSELRAVENEVLLMNFCGSERFLELYGFVHVHDPLQSYSLICVELAVGGALSQFLSTFPASPVSLLFVFLFDIICALEYLHQRRIIHRDVKTDNVLLTADLRCKLIDFGFAKEQLSSTLGTHSRIGGAVAFLAPEVINREGCNHRSDIYSFGMLCSHVLTGRLPDSRMSISNLVDAAVSVVPSSISSILQSLLGSCMSTNPSHRPSAREIRVKIQELVGTLGNPLRHCNRSGQEHADSFVVSELKQHFHSISTDFKSNLADLTTIDSPLKSIYETPVGNELASWIAKLQNHPRLKGFPLDVDALSKIFLSEFVSTIDHLIEVKSLFTPEFFREKKLPLVLANILSSEIQQLVARQTEADRTSKRAETNLPNPPTTKKIETTSFPNDPTPYRKENRSSSSLTGPSAIFVRHVTMPDETCVESSSVFLKTWRMRNDGPQSWPEGCSLVSAGGDVLYSGNQLRVPVASALPGEDVDLSLTLTAPEPSGRHIGYFQLQDPGGKRFGPRIWSDIRVKELSEQPNEMSSPSDNSKIRNLSSLNGNKTNRNSRSYASMRELFLRPQPTSQGKSRNSQSSDPSTDNQSPPFSHLGVRF